MNIKQLNEVLSLYTEGKFKFANFDVAGLYRDIVPEEFHYITEDEVEEIKDYLNLDEIETEEELRAMRNTIVKYCSDNTDRSNDEELYQQWKEENPYGSFKDFMKQNPRDIMWDQMSAFTSVIDNELYERFGHV